MQTEEKKVTFAEPDLNMEADYSGEEEGSDDDRINNEH
jgi:hypothetical protein